MGILYRGTSKNSRFAVVDTKDILKTMINRKNIDIELRKNKNFVNTISQLIGFTIMLGTTLKSFKSFSVILNSDYIFKSIVFSMNEKKEIKGYIALNEKATDNTKAFLRVIVDIGLKEPYNNITEINYNNLLNNLIEYFYTSEQIPTLLSIGASLDNDGNIKSSGAMLMQALPEASEDFLEIMDRKSKALRPINELFDGGLSLERMIELLYDDMQGEDLHSFEEYKILAKEDISYKCDCNSEKIKEKLMSLGQKEIEKILKEDGKIDVECHFCDSIYNFKKEDFKGMI